jgi:hypothetical protein
MVTKPLYLDDCSAFGNPHGESTKCLVEFDQFTYAVFVKRLVEVVVRVCKVPSHGGKELVELVGRRDLLKKLARADAPVNVVMLGKGQHCVQQCLAGPRVVRSCLGRQEKWVLQQLSAQVVGKSGREQNGWGSFARQVEPQMVRQQRLVPS